MRYVPLADAHTLIAEAHKKSGLSVKAFAERYGLTRPTMSNIVNGNTHPSRDLLEQLGLRIYVGVASNLDRGK